MRQNLWMRLILWLVLGMGLMGLSGSGIAQEKASVNLLSNPGFEEDKDANGLPDGWRVKPDTGEPKNPIMLDKTEKHSGKYSVKIKHQLDTSYSRFRGGDFKPNPNTDYVASCWVKIDWEDKIKTSIPGSLGVELFIGDELGNTLAASKKLFQTAGAWQRIVVPFNSGNHSLFSFILYLHQGAGTVWFDDAELIEGTKPTELISEKKAESEAIIFPLVDFRPAVTSNEKTFYLIEKEPLHLELYYMGDATINDLKLVMEVPEGVAIFKDYASAGDPLGKTVMRQGKKYTRYVLNVPTNLILPSFNVWRPHILILEANGPVNQNNIYWYLKAGEDKDKERQLTLITLPALAVLEKTPKHFRIVAGYVFTLKNAPKGESYDLLFERMLKFYIKSGITGSLCYQISHERMKNIVQQTSWTNNLQAGWDPEAAPNYINSATLKEIQAVDENGARYSKLCPCPTYCFHENIMGKVASEYFCHYSSSIAPSSLKKTDFFEIDYEPHHKGWFHCYCERCLKAFSEHSGIPFAELTPKKILSEHIKAWRDFRSWQNAQMISQFTKVVKGINPKVQVGLCANPSAPWDPALMDPFVDFHQPMVYLRHPADFFKVIDEQIKRVKKPLAPWVAVGSQSSGLPGWLQSPAAMKLNILSTATAGGKGFCIWQCIDELCGLDLVKIRECNDIIARLEDYFFKGKRVDEIIGVAPTEKGALYGKRVHKLEDKYLISIFNFHSKKGTTLNIEFSDIAPGKYSLYDPISKKSFTLSKQKPIWTEKDLKSGFSLNIPVSEVKFMILKPYERKDRTKHTLKLGRQVKTGVLSRTDVVVIPKISIPPVIDGKLNDSIWKRAVRLSGFIASEDLAQEQTSAYILYDDSNLYLAVECQESKIKGLVNNQNKRDSEVYRDDCIELFLRPGGDKEYYHLVLNSQGTLYDARGNKEREEDAWNGDVKIKTSLTDKSWIIELSIPFTDFNVITPKEGDVWELNLCRERKANKKNKKTEENSSWVQTFGSFVPPKFGKLIWGGSSVVE